MRVKGMELLTRLREQRRLTDLDVHFAALMCRLAGEAPEELALAAALVSNSRGDGHVCMMLDDYGGRDPAAPGSAVQYRAPEAKAWGDLLHRFPVVGRPGEFCPLILDERGRLYLHRYWSYERALADQLLRLARMPNLPFDEASAISGLSRLFPDVGPGEARWQKLAAATALLRPLSVISGGPGTGKTSTVVRILALMLEGAGGNPLDIAMAAPTGKAALRLQESVRCIKQNLPVAASVLETMPEEASTLHRLLGGRPDSIHFRHNRDNPLSLDVLILDEASMVDMALMAKLLQAMPEHARLILLGDKDQLASVEAGAVLGDVCGSLPGFSETFSRQLQRLTGESVPAGEGAGSPLRDSIVDLQHSFRFGGASGIGQMAQAVNRGDASRCLELLSDSALPDIRLLGGSEDYLAWAVTAYRSYFEAVTEGASVEVLLREFEQIRLLCAVRRGPRGVIEVNRLIEQSLEGAGLLHASRDWYDGRPVMILRNDYNLRLFNGDIGIFLKERGQVCFTGVDGEVRCVAPSRLPEHETAFALTVHKSQGSEFDRLLLLLPDRDTPLLSRELIYTGMTRARQEVTIAATEAVLRSSVERSLNRMSGLRDALWGDVVQFR